MILSRTAMVRLAKMLQRVKMFYVLFKVRGGEHFQQQAYEH